MLNKAQIIGHTGNDPEIRYSQGGAAIATLSIATTETWKDKNDEKQERTEWHRVTAFGRLAEIIGEYVKKGQQIYIEGRLQTDKYTDKDGVEKYSTKIIANEMKLLGKKESNGGGERNAPAGERSSGGRGKPASAPPSRNDDPFPDDDIPF